jgi:putative ABC transport system permease protein
MYMLDPASAALPIIRIDGSDMRAALAEIDSVWNRLAPNVTIKRRLMDEVLSSSLTVFTAITNGFQAVAMLALVIAVLGLIGMSMHIIGRRTHEIGVRKSLGASVKQILVLLLKDLSKPIVIANVAAWPLAFGAMSLYLSIFVTRTTLSVAPFLLSLIITLIVAWTAVIVQATRAARLNPATVLRHE